MTRLILVGAIVLGGVTPAFAQSDLLNHVTVGAYMVGQFTDIATTEYCIGRGTCTEANPLMRWASDRPIAMAVVKGSVATISSAILIHFHETHPRATFTTALLLTLGQAWLTYHNWHVPRRTP